METSPEAQIRSRIAAEGQITFAEFMQVALYHPHGGFYSSGGGVGPDYFTSPAAHPAFAAVIAMQLRSMWEAFGQHSTFYVIEPGASNGLLAADVQTAASSDFADALRYIAVDRTKPSSLDRGVERVTANGLPFRSAVGCIISNELFDAFPVHRFRISHGKIEEIFVTTDANGALIDAPGEPSTPLIEKRVRRLGVDLPDGYEGEVCVAIEPWMAQAAELLERGFVLTIDYGYDGIERLRRDRSAGTLQTYRRHTQGTDLYGRIGRQDITADVDFGHLEDAGDAAGLRTVGRVDQSEFLRRNGFDYMLDRLRRMDLGERERQANRLGMLELVKSPGLGNFKVLVQEKNTGVSDLAELFSEPSALET
ncbi:MAG: SAM-dependent methyltransferase, partial [Chloroflexi bacterium]|nr:SAM-dependent methyltransferase [Chloroflexota bacterium]